MRPSLFDSLAQKELILASGSPRRKQLLTDLGFDFRVDARSVEENYPSELQGAEIAEYLAKLKASPFTPTEKQIIITSDTVVWHKGASLAKAANVAEARSMLSALSGDWHEVISGLCLTASNKQWVGSQTTRVKFAPLSEEEINYYIEHCQPFDKAGAYGIQEWIGLIGIEGIEGSYFNVVGLPVQLLYQQLASFV